jgi:hypothetical protein
MSSQSEEITGSLANLLLFDKNEELQELIQCNICFNVPKGHIYNCPKGHSVCSDCCAKLPHCPVCVMRYDKSNGGSRNFSTENVLSLSSKSNYKSVINSEALMKIVRYIETKPKGSAKSSQQNVESRQPPATVPCPYASDGCKSSIAFFDSSGPWKYIIRETKNGDACRAREIL